MPAGSSPSCWINTRRLTQHEVSIAATEGVTLTVVIRAENSVTTFVPTPATSPSLQQRVVWPFSISFVSGKAAKYNGIPWICVHLSPGTQPFALLGRRLFPNYFTTKLLAGCCILSTFFSVLVSVARELIWFFWQQSPIRLEGKLYFHLMKIPKSCAKLDCRPYF